MNYAPIMPAFVRHPKEAAIIGRMLAGYGELEFLMCLCLSEVLGDTSQAARILFRSRGEEHRISTADAILRPAYEKHSLLEPWTRVRRAMGWCKTTRNRYSHCHWLDDEENGLFFTHIEKRAKTLSGEISLEFFHVDELLLGQQEAHFRYAGDGLVYLRAEHRRKLGKSRRHAHEEPAEKEPPPHNPPEEHPLRKIGLGGGKSPPEDAEETM
jgi:hypothetical protein